MPRGWSNPDGNPDKVTWEMSDGRVIKIRDISPILPALHYDLNNVFPGETDYLSITGMAVTN
jgi:hypothetical protein